MNIDRLIKLLQLTKSPNDNEALVALRKANTFLEGHGLDWDGLFSRLLQQQQQSIAMQQSYGTGGWAVTVNFR